MASSRDKGTTTGSVVLIDMKRKLNEIKRELRKSPKLNDTQLTKIYKTMTDAKLKVFSYSKNNVMQFIIMMKFIYSRRKWTGNDQYLRTIYRNINRFLIRAQTKKSGTSLTKLLKLCEKCNHGLDKQNNQIRMDVKTSIANITDTARYIVESVETKIQRGAATSVAFTSSQRCQKERMSEYYHKMKKTFIKLKKRVKEMQELYQLLIADLQQCCERAKKNFGYHQLVFKVDMKDKNVNVLESEEACTLDLPKAVLREIGSSNIRCHLISAMEAGNLDLGANEERTSNILKFKIETTPTHGDTEPVYIKIPYYHLSNGESREVTYFLNCVLKAENGDRITKRIPRLRHIPLKYRMVPCAEFQLTSISELRNTILLVTQHRLTRSKIIGVKGGTVTSESDERAKIYVPPNAFSRDKKIELKVEQPKTTRIQKSEGQITKRIHVKATGPMCTIRIPPAKYNLIMLVPAPPVQKRRKKDLTVLAYVDGEWKYARILRYEKDISAVRTEITSATKRTVAIVRDEEIYGQGAICDVNTLGEQASEMANTEIVTFFYSYNKEDRTLFLECCLKEKLESELTAAERRGFSKHSPPCPEFYLKTISGRAEINFSVDGELHLLQGNDGTLLFETPLNTARYSDILVGKSRSSKKRNGYILISVPQAYTAQHLETNTDGFFAFLPITLTENDQVDDKEVWWDPSIAKAAQLLKKDAVILRELRTFFRVVLQLDDGTIEDIEQRDIRSPKNRLDFGITEWQKIRHGDNGQKNVYHLIRALENAAKEEKCFTRITDVLSSYEDFQEIIRFHRQKETNRSEIKTIASGTNNNTESGEGVSERQTTDISSSSSDPEVGDRRSPLNSITNTDDDDDDEVGELGLSDPDLREIGIQVEPDVVL